MDESKTFGLKSDGTILTEVSAAKITPLFQSVVDDVLAATTSEFGAALDGIYLYGSVVTGKAQVGKSDLDVLLVFKDKISPATNDAVKSLGTRLSLKYEDLLREVGIESTNVAEICSEREFYGGMCFLRHLCVCVRGNDLSRDVADFAPSEKVARGFNGDIAKVLGQFRGRLESAINQREVMKLTQSVSKKIVRTGFSLVMPQAKSWTTDLKLSTETFSRFYPSKANEMSLVLEWALRGTADRPAAFAAIDGLGAWLVAEFERVIPHD